MNEAATPSILLVASQMPQQELAVLAQVLKSQGFAQEAPAEQATPSLRFSTVDKTSSVGIKFFQELGTLRLELVGEMALRIASALADYMETLTVDSLLERFEAAASDMERRIYSILIVLAFPNAALAMAALRTDFVDEGTEASREGIVQGLAFLETRDVGEALEAIEQDFAGEPVAVLSRKAIDALSERGSIRESLTSFRAKVAKLLDGKPQEAYDLLEAYAGDDAELLMALRVLRAAALQALKRYDEAAEALSSIASSDADAAEAYTERALLREATGSEAEALEDIRLALLCEPANARAQAIFDRLELSSRKDAASHAEQLSQLDGAILARPDDARLYIQRADVLLQEARYSEANDDLAMATNLAGHDPRLPSLRAEAFLGMSHLGSALQEAVLALTSHSPQQARLAMLLKARVYLAMDLPERALASIRELDPDGQALPEAQLCQGICLELLGKDAKAEAKYQAVSEIESQLIRLKPTLYRALPVLERSASGSVLKISPKIAGPLGLEPIDPYFKRCAACGELTIKRRTLCRNCSSEQFFE